MKIIRSLVALYDKTVVRIHGFKKVPGSPIEFLYLVPKVYKGPSIILDDGTEIHKEDSIFEIHIINTNLSNLDTGYANLFRMLREELYYVADYMELEENKDVKAVLAISLLHRLAKRAGFTIIEIDNPIMRKLYSLGENILRGTLSEKTPKKKQMKAEAKECWISRNDILVARNKTK